ncbi:hypothetical protein K501DRAFT_305410 [Backusella circina FSU 941]|nr:hypothetical protein K501DRAFT_305410 [Backusella circina FSU 941]
MILKLQDIVQHISRVVYAGAIFSNYFLLYQLKNNQKPSEVNQTLYYNFFSALDGKCTSNEKIRNCFQHFQKETQLKTTDYKSQGFQTIVSAMAQKYETLVRNNVVSNYKTRTLRNLKEILKSQSMSTSHFRSLQEALLVAINSGRLIVVSKKLERYYGEEFFDRITSFISVTQEAIKLQKFHPARYTDLRGQRYFSLLPLYDLVQKNVPIDGQSFWKISKSLDGNNIQKDSKTFEDLASAYFDYFNFKKIGMANKNEKKIFWNVVETDGYSIQFIFKRKKSADPKTKTPKDFKDEVDRGTLVWGQTSTREFYDLCGYNRGTSQRMKYQRENEDTFKFISDLPILKIHDTNRFLDASKIRLMNYTRLSDYYSHNNWRQKGTHEIAKRLLRGSRKYQKSSTIGCKAPRDDKYVSSSPADSLDKPPTTITAFGNGSFNLSMKGTLPAPTKRVKNALKRLIQSTKLTAYIEVDEFMTSQICSTCNKRTLENVETRDTKRKSKFSSSCQYISVSLSLFI